MRPVNLIPPEDRRGEKAPLRTGPLAYVIVAALAVALLGVTLVVLTSNQISDRKAEKASLESQVQQAQAEADKLESFVSFASLQDAREQTVSDLATSRFDWERVLRELAIVIPSDVWLTNLDAKASAQATTSSSSAASSSSSEDIQGPSLDIQGCATGHDAVARFLAALRDVDGVTRATVLSSDRQGPSGSTGGSSASGTTGGLSCASRSFISSFEILIAFDEAQPSAPSSTSATAPATTPTSSASSDAATSDSTSTTDSTQASSGQDSGTFVGTGSAP